MDDGYSGSNFERPAFQMMLEDIKKGIVDCVVVKDLSRFGREYIDAGKYIERLFPALGVRFIAVNDHYDSLEGEVRGRRNCYSSSRISLTMHIAVTFLSKKQPPGSKEKKWEYIERLHRMATRKIQIIKTNW